MSAPTAATHPRHLLLSLTWHNAHPMPCASSTLEATPLPFFDDDAHGDFLKACLSASSLDMEYVFFTPHFSHVRGNITLSTCPSPTRFCRWAGRGRGGH